jgi:hypothetical protein
MPCLRLYVPIAASAASARVFPFEIDRALTYFARIARSHRASTRGVANLSAHDSVNCARVGSDNWWMSREEPWVEFLTAECYLNGLTIGRRRPFPL